MKLKVFKDYNHLSEAVANEIIELVNKKPDAVVCMASGDTPRLACKFMAEKSSDTKNRSYQINLSGAG